MNFPVNVPLMAALIAILGVHAGVINRILQTLPELRSEQGNRPTLQELLGHKPIEVFCGALLGIGIGSVFH